MAWQQQQQQQQQPDFQPRQQQSISMTTQMMPTTAMYMSSGGDVQMRSNSVAPTVTYVNAVPVVHRNPSIAETYLSRQSMGLGITLIVIGVLSSIFNGVGFAVYDEFAPIGHGFWCGAMFIITGSFGIAAANKKRCFIVTFMILSIKSAIITIFLLGFGIGGAVNSASCQRYYYGYGYYCQYGYSYQNAALAMESLLAILAGIAAVVSIWGSAICCRAVCCCGPTYGSVVATPYGNQQVMIISQQQQPGAVHYAMPQMMPTTYSSSAYPQCSYLPPQQYMAGNLTSQQQQYQQPPSYVFASPSNVDQMPWSVIGHPSSENLPPAYAVNENKGPSP